MSDPQWVTPTVQCNPVYVFDRLMPILQRDVDEFNGLTVEERHGYHVKLDQVETSMRSSIRLRRYDTDEVDDENGSTPRILFIRTERGISVELYNVVHPNCPGNRLLAHPAWNPIQRCHVSINNDHHLALWEFSRHVLLPFFFPHLRDSPSPMIVKKLQGA
ncbi:MAG: hypothetical protein OXB94_13930 [Nitrospira sp.]|nr:hypothetical protein [Nitrospira sp.]